MDGADGSVHDQGMRVPSHQCWFAEIKFAFKEYRNYLLKIKNESVA
jgi:hypothetical protein